jgi:hypothetical protein
MYILIETYLDGILNWNKETILAEKNGILLLLDVSKCSQ